MVYRNKNSLRRLQINKIPDLLSEDEVIAILDIPRTTFYDMKLNGKIHVLNFGNTERFNKTEVIKLKGTFDRKKEKNDKHLINEFIKDGKSNLKMIWGDARYVLSNMMDNSIDVMVTSPPYFNARDYSIWESLEDYLKDMTAIFTECFRVLGNHRNFVLNVGDINCQLGKQPWTNRRIPLGALFTTIFQDIGFKFSDDFIWDKGEPQSFRHQNGKNQYPFYIYPVNCYEHILIFQKHIQDMTRIACPVCGSLDVQNNSQSEIGVQSWECNNLKCPQRSAGNRGKRFSARSIMMNYGKKKENWIDDSLISKWRRDIVKFSPVVKIGRNGENRAGHSAPFPLDIPEMAIKYYSFVGDKILDPFSGSFTTAIAAYQAGRIGIGIDVNKKLYRNIVIERIKKEQRNNNKLFGNKEITYQELDVLKQYHLPRKRKN